MSGGNMRIKVVLLAFIIMAIGLGGCLDSPSSLGPSGNLGCLYQSDLTSIGGNPVKIGVVNTNCSLPALGCFNGTQVIHNRSQLLALDSSCNGATPSASCTDPCDFNTQMLLGYSANVSCMASTMPHFYSVCYSRSQVVVTITAPVMPTQVLGGIQYQCNSVMIFSAWVVVPASNLPVVFNYN